MKKQKPRKVIKKPKAVVYKRDDVYKPDHRKAFDQLLDDAVFGVKKKGQ